MLPAAFAALTWMAMNQFHIRYSILSGELLACGAASTVSNLTALLRRFDRAPTGKWLESVAVLAFALTSVGLWLKDFPVAERGWGQTGKLGINRNVDLTSLVNAQEIDGLVGNYWEVWPSVWHLNAQGRHSVVGVTIRSKILEPALRDLLKSRGYVVLASKPGEQSALRQIQEVFPQNRISVLKGRSATYWLVSGLAGSIPDGASEGLAKAIGEPQASLAPVAGLRVGESLALPVGGDIYTFGTHVGALSKGKIQTQGKAGLLVYGPYVWLAPGSYEVDLVGEFSSLDGSSSPGTFDIARRGGQDILLTSSLPLRFGENAPLRYSFDATGPAERYELRISVTEQTKGSIDHFVLKRVLSSSDSDGKGAAH